MDHDHSNDHSEGHTLSDPAWQIFDALVIAILIVAALSYAWALWSARARGPWPAARTAAWYGGLTCVGLTLTGPVAAASHSSFTAHMLGHLLLGMLAPLLLVLSAPVTLALQALPATHARRLTRLLRTPFVRIVSHPVTAGVLNAGGLWALYTTGLYQAMHGSVLLHALVHAHVFLAGYVFTAALVGVDPDPHRAPFRMRAVVLFIFIAAHSILAKWLYAHPPAGVEAADAQAGSQLMYYGGDAVDVVLLVLLGAAWYRATRPSDAATITVKTAPSQITQEGPMRGPGHA